METQSHGEGGAGKATEKIITSNGEEIDRHSRVRFEAQNESSQGKKTRGGEITKPLFFDHQLLGLGGTENKGGDQGGYRRKARKWAHPHA